MKHAVAIASLLLGSLATAEPKAQSADLAIATDFGERVLEFDFPAMRVGIAEYPAGPTGVTVLHFPQGASVAADIRGGSPGFLGDYGYVHAIALAGGSLLGLEAASGVAAGLWAEVDAPRWDAIPLVSGGIVFDFGGRDNGIHPDKRLGRAALQNAVVGRFPLGARGAGSHVTVGNGFAFDRGERAGQGAAFRETGGIKVLVCTVLNAVGAIFDREGEVVLGHANPETGEREGFPADLQRRIEAAERGPSRNTTLTVVVTNQTVRGHDLAQLGRQVHSSMARAIQPFHTRDDGDILWTVSTAEVDVPQWSITALGVLASEVAWDAVLEAHP